MNLKHFLYLTIVFFILSFFGISITGKIKDEKKSVKHAQRVFLNKETLATTSFETYKNAKFEKVKNKQKRIKNKGVTVLVYNNDSLIFWSDNNIPVEYIDSRTIQNNSTLSILHSTYYCIVDTLNSKKLIGIIHLSSNYPYQNTFLKNGANPDFHLPDGVKITKKNIINSYPLLNRSGNIVAYFDFDNVGNKNNFVFKLLATICFFLGILFLLYFLRLLLKQKTEEKYSTLPIYVFLCLFSVRLILLLTGALSHKFLLFDPFIYATKLAPTFGDLILNTLLFVFATYTLYRFVRLPEKYLRYKHNLNAWIGILNVCFLAGLIYANYACTSLITHSSLIIVVHNISQLEFPVIIAYLVLVLNYLGVVLIALWVFKTLVQVKLYRLFINCGVLLGCLYLTSLLINEPIDIYSIVFSLVLYIVSGLMKDKLHANTMLSSLVVFLLLFSIYIMLFTVNLSGKKESLRYKSQAISLSSEHDPIAEYLFKDISVELKKDTVAKRMLKQDDFNIEQLYNYLTKNYFNGYWKKYETQITVCRPQDSVLVSGNNLHWYPCYDFFADITKNQGINIPNSDFYYVDKFTGLINYLGKIKLKLNKYLEISLFIELDSKLTTKQLGYPELLLDEGLKKQNETVDFSYAKYHKGRLISHSGKYEYSLIPKVFQDTLNFQFKQLQHNDYEHLVYHPSNDNIIVISKPEVNFADYLVLFSYIFVFYYLLALMVILVFVSQYRHINFRDSLKNKIQFSVISILIASLLLIAGSTTWFNVRKYNQTQFRILEEKINSVYVELEHKLAYEEQLTANWHTAKYDNLGQLLVKFSDVFYSDINLYDPSGNLLATSRDRIFQLGLQSKKMDPLAYAKMSNEQLARFVHREKINNLAYLSAYVPFINNQGELLAYLNLPYFTKQKELQEDITTLTVAIINIYVLLILLTIIIAVVISDQITKPLEMIQNRFRALKLGSQYEPIEYEKKDEIGRLVAEYNRMVLELEKNVQLLAKSERESAWREMAKQVAHEIKNPLTPMRLSVQQLKRSWDDKKEDFDKYLNRVTETLIEQIDNLANIAGEFSNFAIMPEADIRNVDVNEVLKASADLFKANEHIKVKLKTVDQKIWVMADSDQLSRVFINIIKNGIQSIPDSRKGEVSIELIVENDSVKIELKDNGRGVPDEIKHKLFAPNFTTKSGGMGLGLAIVKNILDSINGTISLSTTVNIGSKFTVILPINQK